MTVLMLGSILILYVPPTAEAQAIPEITVVPTDPTITLDVSPRGTGLGFTTLTVINAGASSVRVRVQTNVPGYQVSPAVAVVNVPGSSEIPLPVAVATMLRGGYKVVASTVHAEVTHVSGAPINGVSEADTSFLVQSEPYGKVILRSEKPFQKVGPGKEYPFKIQVVNNGNSLDTFSIEVTNKDKLQDKGFSISLSSTTTKDTEPQAYDNVIILMQTPREWGWKNDYYNLEIKATSDVEGSGVYSVTVWVYGFGVYGFEPLYSIFALALIGAFMAKKREQK